MYSEQTLATVLSPETEKRLSDFNQALVTSVAELAEAGIEWTGGGAAILVGVDKATGAVSVAMTCDQGSEVRMQAALKALQAYRDVLYPEPVPGQYL